MKKCEIFLRTRRDVTTSFIIHQTKLHHNHAGLEVKCNHFHLMLSLEGYIKFNRPPVVEELHPHW